MRPDASTQRSRIGTQPLHPCEQPGRVGTGGDPVVDREPGRRPVGDGELAPAGAVDEGAQSRLQLVERQAVGVGEDRAELAVRGVIGARDWAVGAGRR